MAKKKKDAQKALYKDILSTGQAYGAAADAGWQAQKPRRKLGDRLLTVLIVVLVAVVVVLGVLLFRVEVLGTEPAALLGGLGIGDDGGAKQAQLPVTAEQLEGTLFIGDSNTVRLETLGLVEDEQVLARESIGISAVTDMAFVTLEGSSRAVTVVQAVEKLRPELMVITLGTNDIGNRGVTDFIRQYNKALDALEAASPGSTIVVNAIPPVCQYNSYSKLTREEVQSFNAALAAMCAERGLRFLDSCTEMADADGHLPTNYADGDGVHLSLEALTAFMLYFEAEVLT
ncbi:MAG: hypothetical protein GXY32_07065 [Ruminococcaceae bacterium]|nr:hypothetical protein [Oscillospiraceae bacterium]